jgi:hypothetical protein
LLFPEFYSLGGGTIAQNDSGSRTFIIFHARVFDGTRVLTADSAFVQDGKIAELGNDLVRNGMFSNEFWREFLMGGGLAFLVFYVTLLITRNRKKGSRF